MSRLSPVTSAVVALLALPSLAAGCILGDETDVAGLIGSQFVMVRLTEADLDEGVLASQTELNPDTFLSQIKSALGRAPTAVEVTRVAVSVSGEAKGVASWRDAFSGDISVSFVVSGAPPIVVGTLPLPASGLGAIEGRVLVAKSTLDNFPDVAAGRFAVQLSGASARSAAEELVLPARVEVEFLTF